MTTTTESPGPSAAHEPPADDAGAAGRSALFRLARTGDQHAWRMLRESFDPLVRRIGFRHRLSADDVDDLSQRTWLKLYQCVDAIRDPAALPGWIKTTATREAIRASSTARRWSPLATDRDGDEPRSLEPDPSDELLRAERRRAVREGLNRLKSRDRELLTLLVAEPPLSYEQISRRLGVPVGSIGPTRARCLAKLRDMEPIQLVA